MGSVASNIASRRDTIQDRSRRNVFIGQTSRITKLGRAEGFSTAFQPPNLVEYRRLTEPCVVYCRSRTLQNAQVSEVVGNRTRKKIGDDWHNSTVSPLASLSDNCYSTSRCQTNVDSGAWISSSDRIAEPSLGQKGGRGTWVR